MVFPKPREIWSGERVSCDPSFLKKRLRSLPISLYWKSGPTVKKLLVPLYLVPLPCDFSSKAQFPDSSLLLCYIVSMFN